MTFPRCQIYGLGLFAGLLVDSQEFFAGAFHAFRANPALLVC
jgi:hypothetical protein